MTGAEYLRVMNACLQARTTGAPVCWLPQPVTNDWDDARQREERYFDGERPRWPYVRSEQPEKID